MKPNDYFFYGQGRAPQKDSTALLVYYYPIIGSDAFALYHYLLSFWDDGRSQTQVSQVLNHLQFGPERFNQALELLQAVKLVDRYQTDTTYLYLRAPLGGDDFFQDNVLRSLLKTKIGEVALKALEPAKPQGQKQEVDTGKFFNGLLVGDQPVKPKPNYFDQETFQVRMEKAQLSYEDKDTDILALELYARQYHLNWSHLYQLAEATAVQGRISVKRMEAKLKQTAISANFSPEESFFLSESKSQSALEFLSQLKDTRGSQVNDKEQELIVSLQKQGFLDEVISILLLLAYNRDTSLHINERYVLRVAEDFKKQGIVSAEEAILRVRKKREEKNQSSPKSSFKAQGRRQTKPQQSNVPEWSQKDYVDQTTPEEMQAREAKHKRLFQQLKGEGN